MFEPEGLAAALTRFGESRMLPAEAYTSEAVLAWERRHFFAGAWVCVGRTEELRGDGARAANQRAAAGVLLTHDGETLRAFANVCRHRAHELLPDGGTADRRAIVCPYHGWSYRLDGALATAPGMPVDFDRTDHGLVELPVIEWHGWAFVNATSTAPPFADVVGALDGLIAPYAPEHLRERASHTYQVAANWKVIVENYHECYHCPLIHPALCRVSPPSSGTNWDLPGAWVGGEMDLRDGVETMSLDGRSRGRFIEGAPRDIVRYVGLFPNLLISAHPDYVLTHLLTPVTPGLTTVDCSWYAPDGVIDVTYAVDFWDVTNREDWAACESVQRGVSSPHYRPGPLASTEDAVYQWVRLIAQAYRDLAGPTVS